MDRATAIARLKSFEPELRALGVESLSLFGSTARDEARPDSDIDVAVSLEPIVSGFEFFGRLDRVREELSQRMGIAVDVIPEPRRPNRIKAAIDKDRQLVF